MNSLVLDKTGSWTYVLTINPKTPAQTIKLDGLVSSHSEFQTPFDQFIEDELISMIIGYQPNEVDVFSHLHVANEVLIGHTNVCFIINFIFGNGVGIHHFKEEFFKIFEAKISNYFKDYYIEILGNK